MISCVITSSKETIVHDDLQSVSLPAFRGQIQVLSGHVESFLVLKKGNVVIKKMGEKQDNVTQILGGECHIKDDIVNIIL